MFYTHRVTPEVRTQVTDEFQKDLSEIISDTLIFHKMELMGLTRPSVEGKTCTYERGYSIRKEAAKLGLKGRTSKKIYKELESEVTDFLMTTYPLVRQKVNELKELEEAHIGGTAENLTLFLWFYHQEMLQQEIGRCLGWGNQQKILSELEYEQESK